MNEDRKSFILIMSNGLYLYTESDTKQEKLESFTKENEKFFRLLSTFLENLDA